MSLLIVHAAATWFMVGLIWMTQLVHYPLFSSVDAGSFASYEQRHTRRMGALLVIPAGTEVVTAAAIAIAVPETTSRGLALLAGAVLAGIWMMTAFVQAPLHGRLSLRHDRALIARLVRTNWYRTAAWSTRGALAAVML